MSNVLLLHNIKVKVTHHNNASCLVVFSAHIGIIILDYVVDFVFSAGKFAGGMTSFSDARSFFPMLSPELAQIEAGFRFGSVGTHSSRTLMLSELQSVLDHTASDSDRAEYKRSVVDDNCLGKPTASTRRLSFQRLTELYSLDPQVPLFRLLRRLWAIDAGSQPLLAILVALARDPLLRSSAPVVLNLKVGEEFSRTDTEAVLRTGTEGRLNDSILAKVVRNCASSWAQTGHLHGRTFKHRQQIKPHFVSVTMALAVGFMGGIRGESLFSSPWMRVLDADPIMARNLALEAKRAGLLDLRISDKIVDLQLERLGPSFASSLK